MLAIAVILAAGATGATPAPLSAGQPSWSPDSIEVAFSGVPLGSLRGDVYVIGRDGTGLTNLTAAADEHGSVFPSWSPDGTLIASGSELGGPTIGSHEVYFVSPAGGGATQPVATSTAIGQISWSYDGRWLAIHARDSAILARTDGSDQHTVAEGACCGIWSPRSLRLAVSILHTIGYGGTDVYLVDPAGRVLRQLTRPPKHRQPGVPLAINNTTIAWSRDGSRLLFSSQRTPRTGLYVMRPDGSHQVRVATANVGDISPRGTAVVYSGKGIWVVGADGKHRHQLSPNGTTPRWSPDGQWIAYTVKRATGVAGIDLVRPDGTQRHPLVGG